MSAHRDTLKSLADARPDQLNLDPDTYRVDVSTIMANFQPATPEVRRPTRRLVLAGLVAVGAVAVTAGVNATRGGRPGPSASGAPATDPLPASAQELFLVAAERNMSNTTTNGRYWVVSREDGDLRQVGPANRPYHVMRRHGMETWLATRAGEESFAAVQRLGATPVTDADRAAWKADGSPTQWSEPGPGEPAIIKAAAEPRYARPFQDPTRVSTYPFGAGEMTAAQLAALPTDPVALRNWLHRTFKDQGGLESPDYSLFWTGRHLVFDLPVSPQVRAAAYQMFAEIEEVAFLGPATDQRGRRGMAVAYTRKGDGGSWQQTRLIIDPQTGQALAQESWNLGTGKSAAATGELTGYTLLLRAEFSDDNPPTDLPEAGAR